MSFVTMSSCRSSTLRSACPLLGLLVPFPPKTTKVRSDHISLLLNISNHWVEVLYAHFAESIAGKVVRVKAHTWCIPSYRPENAALSVGTRVWGALFTYNQFQKAIWAVVRVDPSGRRCSCSCIHAKYLLAMKDADLRCWHIVYLQKNKELMETLEMCTTPQLHSHGTDKEHEEDEYAL